MRKINPHIATCVAMALVTTLANARTAPLGAGDGESRAQLSAAPASKVTSRVAFDIPAQSLSASLKQVAEQAGVQILFEERVVSGINAPAIKAIQSTIETLQALLKNTDLEFTSKDQTIAVRRVQTNGKDQELPVEGSKKGANTSSGVTTERNESAREELQEFLVMAGIPEILVVGSYSSNTDIRRTRDDVQPYVVFDAEEITRSMASDVESFLKTRLPMNQSRGSEGQNVTGTRGNQSSIDLRGLGANQTLILVNGRRMPGVSNLNDFYQPDINGIPLSAIERIEILPSTAGGIYGGGATGGVVNVILKRDYDDLAFSVRYDGTFAGGGAQRRIDGTAGFTLEEGKTHVMLTGSYRDGNPLYVGDRDFLARSRALHDRNNHAFFVNTTSPVHGYTTNIVSADGSDLVLSDGMRSLNSPIAHVPVGYAGPGSDNGAAFLNTAGQYNLTPANDVLGNGYDMLQSPEVSSMQVSLRREFTDRIEAYADGSRYDNRAVRVGSPDVLSLDSVLLPAGPNSPFVQDVMLSVPVVGLPTDRLHATSNSLSEQLIGGVIVRLPREWMMQGEYNWGRSRYTYRQPSQLLSADGAAALIDGRLDPLRDVNAYPLDLSAFDPGAAASFTSGDLPADQKDATLRVSGPLWTLAGGPLRLASVLERRTQYTGDQVLANYPNGDVPTFSYYPDFGARTDSAYAELTVPLFSAANAQPGFQGLDLLVSYRYDLSKIRTRQSGDGFSSVQIPSADGPFPDLPFQTREATGNQYTFGLSYTPVKSLVLRMSYGKGILPPSPNQLSELSFPPIIAGFFLDGVVDPKRGGQAADTLSLERFTLLGSTQLRPELSTSWSAGLIFKPAMLPGLRLSLDYTRIDKTDEIGALDTQVLFDLENQFPGAIVRNDLTSADAALGYTGGTIRELNTGNVNIAKSRMEAVDLQADYQWQTRLGSFIASVIGTVEPTLSQQAAPGGDEINRVGYSNGPLKRRGNVGLLWNRGAIDLGWNMQYYDRARIYTSTSSDFVRDRQVANQGTAWIPTQTYHDVHGRYRFDNMSGGSGNLLQNSEVRVAVQNVLNTSPPILTSSSYLAVGSYANEGDPRLRRYSITLSKRF